jgi:hypothetical protein
MADFGMCKRSSRSLLATLGVCLGAIGCGSPADDVPNAAGSPTAVTAPAPSAATSATPSAISSPTPVKPEISKAGLAYFFAVALGTEFGDDAGVVTMWNKPEVSVRVHGGNAASRNCLDKVVSDFNSITETTDMKLTSGAADVELHFAPVSKFDSIEPNYVPGNDGFFYFYWSDQKAITDATVLISSSGIAENVRCHLIREELTQAMGFAKDSSKYPDSVFHDNYESTPTQYSSLDKEIIRLLYSGAVQPGDDKKSITKSVIAE